MKQKTYKCTICSKEFQKFNSFQKTCSPKCENKRLEIKEKEKKKIAKEKKAISVAVLKVKLWKIVSEYIRRKWAINDYNTCITCWVSKHWKDLEAGHFVPAWSSNYLRFVEVNIHPQCHRCNCSLHSNPIEYRLYMDNRYGKDFVDKLVSTRNEIKRFTSEELLNLIDIYSENLYNLNLWKNEQ